MKKAITIILCIVIILGGITAVGYCKFRGGEPTSLSASGIGTAEDPVMVTAHRGCHAACPENSLPAFEKAAESGNYYAAECDIYPTTDGVWVVTHDDYAIRHFFSFGKITEMTFEEVKKLHYSFDKEFWNYTDASIPSLDEYLDAFAGSSVRPEIEIKSSGTDGLEDVVSTIEEKGFTEKAIIISFNIDQLEKVHELNPDIELWYLTNEITDEEISDAKAAGCEYIGADYRDVDEASIKNVTDSGLQVALWTVDSLDDVTEFYNMGVRYFTSNTFCN